MLSKIKDIGYFNPFKNTDIVNNVEMRVIGLARSGTHPIINWIGCQCRGKGVLFINNVKPKENPFACLGKRRDQMLNEFYVNKNFEMIGNFKKKDCIIYHYENALVEEVVDALFEENREKYLGKSAKKYDVLIMRDAFNYFASRMQFQVDTGPPELQNENRRPAALKSLVSEWVKFWKNHAKEFLGTTNLLGDAKVTISYNDWCKSLEYRKTVANKLDLIFLDKGVCRVARIGGGSSFDRLKYKGKAGEMKTEERWKNFMDNDIYRGIFKDKELVDLSGRIFGEIPGTGILL